LAVRSFPQICKEAPSVTIKAADVLGQLLQADAQMELDNVNHSLLALLKINAKGNNIDEFRQDILQVVCLRRASVTVRPNDP
jgi:hypothetical protein